MTQGAGGDAPARAVDTLDGRLHVRWDEGAAAMGVFERWVSACPLWYRSGNTPDKRDMLGTLMPGLLTGHRRCGHITALRGDAVGAQALERIDGRQLRLHVAGPSVHEGDRLWDYAELVTDVEYPLEAIGQRCRDPADSSTRSPLGCGASATLPRHSSKPKSARSWR